MTDSRPGTPTDAAPGRRLVPYSRALERQRELVKRRQGGDMPDVLWLLEHPPTITWGSAGGESHLLVPRRDLEQRGVTVVATERGGDVTCHEPGQLVGYPIVQLGPGDDQRDLHLYLRQLEEGLLAYVTRLGLEAGRIEGRTGVWIPGSPPRKVAAIGVRCSRWVTSHGFALNVENDLEGFRAITPCGIRDAAVTSLARELREPPSWADVVAGVHGELEESLGRKLELVCSEEAFGL